MRNGEAEAGLRLAGKVFEQSNEAIMIADAENRILQVNAAFTRITGYQSEEVLGHNPRLLSSGRQSPQFYHGMWQQLLSNTVGAARSGTGAKAARCFPNGFRSAM